MNEIAGNTRPSALTRRAALPLDKAGYDRIHPIVLATFCAYIVTWFLQLGSRVSMLGDIRFEFMLGVVLILLALLTPRQASQTKTDLYGWLAAFFVVLIIQIPFSANV